MNNIASQVSSYKRTSELSDIISTWYDNDVSSTSAVHQEVNGLYTCVKFLKIIAQEKDTKNKYSSTIDTIMDTFATNDNSCDYAPQQVVNGYYRMTELLAVIATIVE